MITREIDFQLIKDKDKSKVFLFTNSDGSIYSMTGSTAICKVYIDPQTPTEITCTVDATLGRIIVPFLALHTSALGLFEYVIEETKTGNVIVPLIKGNITVINYTPFSETIEAYLRSELPGSVTLTEDFRNQKIIYWRKLLQTAFSISDANLNIESAWPTLVNALIAKLVVYDALMLATKGSFLAFLGGDYTSSTEAGGPVKKIETGPSNVEFYSTADGLKSMLQLNAQGVSPLDTLTSDLCGLSNYLGVKLYMCKGNDIKITPRVFQNPDWDYPTLDDMDDMIESNPVSQG
jgi:hypothetical protein